MGTASSRAHFEQISIACGNRNHSYTYRSGDGQEVHDSGAHFVDGAEADAYFRKTVSRAERIIEHDTSAFNAFGKSGERIVFANTAGRDGPDGGVSIVWYNGLEIQTIHAPTEKMARDFEQYLFDRIADDNFRYYLSYLPFRFE